ncbi:MAG: hypothetical protein K8R34_07640 [Methanosarcinales archaeon]|nr:hypothetical protein [Methanosarcinales archaeon]
MTIFHLENNMKNAKSLSKIEGVYWSARDMDPSPVGNHHFITFVYNSKKQAIRVTRQWGINYKSEQNDKDLTVFFTTMGAGKSRKKIIINFNPSSDLKAIHEIAKKDNTNWHSSDYDYEGHRVPYNFSSNNYASSEELMNAILQRVSNFNKRYNAGITVDYSLVDRNCATLVNSIFKVLGYTDYRREEIGEFRGVDWGEEDLIQDSFFDDYIVQPIGPTAQGDDMQPGEVLNPGQSISSINGRYTFVYQDDGNLVLYRNQDRKPLWASGTYGRPAQVCIMQGDGNLVIYDPDGQPIWSSDTWHDPGSRLIVQDDGNVVIYRPDNTPVWATKTGPTAQGDDMQPGEVLNPGQSISSINGRYTFVYQDDGNLVLYRNQDRKPLWASGTYGRPAQVCIMQGDGNLVIYDPDGQPIWSSDTWHDQGSRLIVQNDGNVVIYRPDNTPVWATNTKDDYKADLSWWKDDLVNYFYYNFRIGTPDPKFDYKADLSWWKDDLVNYFYKDMRIN